MESTKNKSIKNGGMGMTISMTMPVRAVMRRISPFSCANPFKDRLAILNHVPFDLGLILLLVNLVNEREDSGDAFIEFVIDVLAHLDLAIKRPG